MEQEVMIYGCASLSGTYYSHLFTTDMSKRLDGLFGFNYVDKFVSKYSPKIKEGTLDISDIDEPEIFMYIRDIMRVQQSPVLGINGSVPIPISREVKHNLVSARSLMAAYNESERIVDFFTEMALKVGFFFALPYDEVVSAYNGIDERDINVALKEGYARTGYTTLVDGNPLKILELTDKFCPLEKRLDNEAFAPSTF